MPIMNKMMHSIKKKICLNNLLTYDLFYFYDTANKISYISYKEYSTNFEYQFLKVNIAPFL